MLDPTHPLEYEGSSKEGDGIFWFTSSWMFQHLSLERIGVFIQGTYARVRLWMWTEFILVDHEVPYLVNLEKESSENPKYDLKSPECVLELIKTR